MAIHGLERRVASWLTNDDSDVAVAASGRVFRNCRTPFERFQKLTKDLLSVPREELQKKLDKYKRQKAKRKH